MNKDEAKKRISAIDKRLKYLEEEINKINFLWGEFERLQREKKRFLKMKSNIGVLQ